MGKMWVRSAKLLRVFGPERVDPFLLEAVRCLLVDLSSPIPILNAELYSVLDGTWAGELLERWKIMKMLGQRTPPVMSNEDPVNIQKRRDEKSLKAERHRERLEQKKERDRLWRTEQAKIRKGRKELRLSYVRLLEH
ncbi:MAG: hypothetical protein IPG67_16935 [Acidobacteria bacterium]|nr:hypothetical protein [Acidobacteriota bacterium]